MRIAILSYEFPPDTGFGGTGTFSWYQARALARLGHDVHMFAGSLEPGTTHTEVDGVRVTRTLDPGPFAAAITALEHDGLPWAGNRLRTGYGAFRALRDALEHEAFDIVEYPECGADGLLVSTMLPVTTCVRFHSPAAFIMGHYDADPRDVEATTFLEQVAINQADVRIAPSRFLAAEVVDRLAVTAPVHTIPNGIDLEEFDGAAPIDVAERFGLPTRDAVVVLFASRVEHRKGGDLLPEVCEVLLRARPDVHVVIAGADDGRIVDDQVRPRLDALGPGHRERLHGLGRRSLAEVRALMAFADVFLLPSRWDNAPYACIEAMAARLPVVASTVGGLPELIGHERSGLLVPPGDAAAVAAAVLRLADDGAARERFGAEARLAVERDFTDLVGARRTVGLWTGPDGPLDTGGR
jgi:glycogen(starch) synthase